MTDNLERLIQDHLTSHLLYVEDGCEYDHDTSFIGEGLIDSMGVMELVSFVQFSFHIPVEQIDVTPDNFDSVNKLAAFVRRKQALKQLEQPGADRVDIRSHTAKQLASSS